MAKDKNIQFRRIGGRIVPIRSKGGQRPRGIDRSKAAGHGRYKGLSKSGRREVEAGHRTFKIGEGLQKAGVVGVGLGLASGIAGAATTPSKSSKFKFRLRSLKELHKVKAYSIPRYAFSSSAKKIGTRLLWGGGASLVIGDAVRQAGIRRGTRAISNDPNLQKKRRK